MTSPSEEKEEPDGPSLGSCLSGCLRGKPYAGSDEERSGDGQRPDHACSPCVGNQIRGQKIPSSSLTLVIGAPQQLTGSGDIFQHL